MFGSIRRRLGFAMALALAACTGVAPAAAQHQVVHTAAAASKPGNRGLFNNMPTWSGHATAARAPASPWPSSSAPRRRSAASRATAGTTDNRSPASDQPGTAAAPTPCLSGGATRMAMDRVSLPGADETRECTRSPMNGPSPAVWSSAERVRPSRPPQHVSWAA